MRCFENSVLQARGRGRERGGCDQGQKCRQGKKETVAGGRALEMAKAVRAKRHREGRGFGRPAWSLFCLLDRRVCWSLCGGLLL